MGFGLFSPQDSLSAHEIGGGLMDIGPPGRLWLHPWRGPFSMVLVN